MPTDPEKLKYVVDASIAVKWFSSEEGSEAAHELLKRGELGEVGLFAPDLLFYEVGNALWKGKGFRAQDIGEALEELFGFAVEFVQLNKALAAHAANFTEAYNLTFYDACYAALAYDFQAVLVSADSKGHGKVKEIEVIALDTFA